MYSHIHHRSTLRLIARRVLYNMIGLYIEYSLRTMNVFSPPVNVTCVILVRLYVTYTSQFHLIYFLLEKYILVYTYVYSSIFVYILVYNSIYNSIYLYNNNTYCYTYHCSLVYLVVLAILQIYSCIS